MELEHTERSGVTLKKNPADGKWQHHDSDGRQVGPRYPTSREALADTNDYVVRAGWVKGETADTKQVAALKLCVEAFDRRYRNTGLNTWDTEAFSAAKVCVKDATGEAYCSGAWHKVA